MMGSTERQGSLSPLRERPAVAYARSTSLCSTAAGGVAFGVVGDDQVSSFSGCYTEAFIAPSHMASLAAFPSLFYAMYAFNPTLSKGNEERALDNILFYHPASDDSNSKMNRVGFATACSCITERFSVGGRGDSMELADEIRTKHRLITLYSPMPDLWFAIETHPLANTANLRSLLKKSVASFLLLCGPRAFVIESPPGKRYVPGVDPGYDQRLRYTEYNRQSIEHYFADFAQFLSVFAFPSPVPDVVVHDGRIQSVSDESFGSSPAQASSPTAGQPSQDPYAPFRQQVAADALLAFPVRAVDGLDSLAVTALETLVQRYTLLVERSCGELWYEFCGDRMGCVSPNATNESDDSSEATSLFGVSPTSSCVTLDVMYEGLRDAGLLNWFAPQMQVGLEGLSTAPPTAPLQSPLSSTPLHAFVSTAASRPLSYSSIAEGNTDKVAASQQPTSSTLSVVLCHVDEGRLVYSSASEALTASLLMLVRTQLPLLDEISVEKGSDMGALSAVVSTRLSSQERDSTSDRTAVSAPEPTVNRAIAAEAVARCSAKAFNINNLTLESLRQASQAAKSTMGSSDEIRLNRRLRALSSKCGVFDVFAERIPLGGCTETNTVLHRASFLRVNGFGVFLLSPPLPVNAACGDPSGGLSISELINPVMMDQHWYYTNLLSIAMLYRRSLLREMVSCCGGVAAHGLVRACELRSSTLRAKIDRPVDQRRPRSSSTSVAPPSATLPTLLRCQLLQQLSFASHIQHYHQPTMGNVLEVLGPSASSVLESLSLEVSSRYLVVHSEYAVWTSATGVDECRALFADPQLPLDLPLRTLKILLRCIDPHDPWVALISKRHPSIVAHHARQYFPALVRSTPQPLLMDSAHPRSKGYTVYPTSFSSFASISRGNTSVHTFSSALVGVPHVPIHSGPLSPQSSTHPTIMAFHTANVAACTPLWVLPRDVQWEVAKYICDPVSPDGEVWVSISPVSRGGIQIHRHNMTGGGTTQTQAVSEEGSGDDHEGRVGVPRGDLLGVVKAGQQVVAAFFPAVRGATSPAVFPHLLQCIQVGSRVFGCDSMLMSE